MDTTEIPCPICKLMAKRVPFYHSQVIITETGVGSKYGLPRSNEAYTKDGRYAVSRFQEASQELDYNYKRAEESAQRELPSHNLYKEGLKRAERLGAKRDAKVLSTAER